MHAGGELLCLNTVEPPNKGQIGAWTLKGPLFGGCPLWGGGGGYQKGFSFCIV